MFFTENGYKYKSVSSAEIKSGSFAMDTQLLIMPGGESITYLKTLQDLGAKNIRNFVDKGGSFAGICAGAYYATSYRKGGVATGKYGIGLLEGTAYDGTRSGEPGFIEGMMSFDVFVKGIASRLQIILLLGPAFYYDAKEAAKKQIEVLARFTDHKSPAMIRFQYGKGRVFLAGPHAEIEEDRTDWQDTEGIVDPESDWPLLKGAIDSLL